MSIMLAVGLTTVNASDVTDVSDKVKESFRKEFAGAESVKWNDLGDYQFATFILGRHRVEAYFNTDGEMEGSARGLLFDELPLAVLKSIDKRFPGAYFIDVLEVSNTEGTSYRLTAVTQNKRFHVKADTGGNILEIVKVKK